MIKQNVLDVLNLCKSYGNHLVLDDISFSIRENEIVVLLVLMVQVKVH